MKEMSIFFIKQSWIMFFRIEVSNPSPGNLRLWTFCVFFYMPNMAHYERGKQVMSYARWDKAHKCAQCELELRVSALGDIKKRHLCA